jgi:hypothetical protein
VNAQVLVDALACEPGNGHICHWRALAQLSQLLFRQSNPKTHR